MRYSLPVCSISLRDTTAYGTPEAAQNSLTLAGISSSTSRLRATVGAAPPCVRCPTVLRARNP